MPNVYQFKDFEGSSHRILIELVKRFSRGRGRLLDLGAAGGELGESLRPLFDSTTGFEFDVDRIEQLKPRFDRVVIADLETLHQLPGGNSAIVMADILEHLRDPKKALSLVRGALRPDGILYVSVPNIANITIRIGLLFGVFRYRDRGILDATHLRFYTSRTIRDEVTEAGFDIIDVRGSSVPIRLIVSDYLPEFLIRLGERILTPVTRMMTALFAYQIILVAKPRERRENER
jgi:Predicted methyltransferase (contains TPR repeat)